ncbi:MAG TPA: FAD-dependent oxidoreductase [Nocardioides sp.]|nr:FAD-dependent oxidoreductase [Nocardioides sp.]
MSAISDAAAPGHVVVVGAGIVGLSTAWHLVQRGVDVLVLDRAGVASGSSRGNAGWVAPGLAVPLSEPGVLRYALAAMVDRSSPLYVPLALRPRLWAFLLDFARRCTSRTWQHAVRAMTLLSRDALAAYDELPVELPDVMDAPLVAGFVDHQDATHFQHELGQLRALGLPVAGRTLSADDLHARHPVIRPRVRHGVELTGQRYLDPGSFSEGLAAAVSNRGATVRSGARVVDVGSTRRAAYVVLQGRERIATDAVVLANGAWLGDFSKALGVRVRLTSGRGYSFTVPTRKPVQSPLYFPAQRLACTPVAGGLRIAGTMEFRRVDDPIDTARVRAMVAAGRDLLSDAAWHSRSDSWVGSRPVTADGLPLIGPTARERVFVAGGHGMWGLTLGPVTGRLLADRIVTGQTPAALQPFHPLR